MSLITNCPACGTSFHINVEQLSAHKGDVRCGKCKHVFNALGRLGEPASSSEAEEPVVAQIPEAAPPLPAKIVVNSPLPPPKPRKSRAWILALSACLLLLVAAAQSAYYLRTLLTMQWPVLKPYLIRACATLNCTISLPQDIAQLTIDDSDLQEDAEHQGLFNLSTTLINRAPFVQAYPLLELTLTNIDDQPLLRRAFTAHEYLPAGFAAETGMPAGEEIHIKLAFTASNIAAAGYRVFITYP